MKKLITLIAFICAVSIGNTYAQSQYPLLNYNAAYSKVTLDTLTNTDTSYLVANGVSSFADLTFQFTNTKVSGTPGGTIILQGNVDGTNWYTLKNDATQTVGISDTVTIANGNTISAYIVKNHPYTNYRIRFISSGTQKSAPTGILYYRKHSQ